MFDKEDAEVQLERFEEIVNKFRDVQRQISNEINELSVADVTCEAKFEEKSLAIKAMLRRVKRT